jgi:hypothetical protein
VHQITLCPKWRAGFACSCLSLAGEPIPFPTARPSVHLFHPERRRQGQSIPSAGIAYGGSSTLGDEFTCADRKLPVATGSLRISV